MIRQILICLIFLPQLLSAQSSSVHQVQGRFSSCDQDTIRLFFLDGISLRQIGKTPVIEDENGKYFAFSFSHIPAGFFFIGGGAPVNTKMVLLGIDSLVFLQGDYASFHQAQILSSRSNDAFTKAMQISQQLQTQTNQVNQQYQRIKGTDQDKSEITQQMNQLDEQKIALLDSLERVHPVLRKAMALRTYLTSPSIQDSFETEVAFFATTYFSQVDLTDSAYQTMPAVNENFQAYAGTLGSLTLPIETVTGYCDSLLSGLPVPGQTHKNAILGLAGGFNGKNDDAFSHYASAYLDLYPGDNPEFAGTLIKEIASKKALLIGAIAPDIKLPTPDGDSLAISDLRGQVVLLDFWASWCRPCRMENPRVKAMYEREKDKGFTILGVSLDRSEPAWIKAIEDDKLPWYHISDLKQWRSQASQMYKVSSIPHTVLLDREGRIVAKGLRGAALEAKVAELLEQQPLQE